NASQGGSAEAPPTAGVGGSAGMQQDEAPDPLDAHMEMMRGASGQELERMLPEHRQLVANTIAQYNREMRDMNMSADADWNAALDAVRQDLVRLPELTPEELKSFIPEHEVRINELREMHREMMSGMKM
ncbi:MAG: hypothetical protein KY464_06910, partial [Gemmatimonadetes bacterium]|nr:hypothetical protein [Gemmatimonadota bacterium]